MCGQVVASFLVLLAACAAAPRSAAPDPLAGLRATTNVPEGCALGLSGPTINPGDAVDYARADALENLALGRAVVALDSIQAISEGPQLRYRAVLKQVAKAHLQGARIVKVWADRSRAGTTSMHDIVYAMACRAEALHHAPPWSRFEALSQTDPARACAWGFAGPTLLSDQNERALADAKARLAEVLSADVESILVDYDLAYAEGWSQVSSPQSVREHVDAEARSEAALVDPDGNGPLGLKGVAYAVACLP